MTDARLFPEGFLWGTSTSPHQVEGDNRGNDWWRWEQQPGRIHDGTRSGAAAEWWAGRAEEDLARAAELGQNAHRLGVEWSRLEPEPGRFDPAAFARYGEILRAGRRLGMRMFVCLHHFTLPAWASRRGSWLDPELASGFARLAAECARVLGDRVDAWVTMNEPSVLAFMGYAQTAWPPGKGSMIAYDRALRHLMRAHRAAYRSVHAERPGARVGIVLNAPVFDPDRPDRRRDRWAAAAQDWAFNGAVLRALEKGRCFDFVGLNYYGRFRVRFDPRAAGTLLGRHVQDGIRTEHVDWGEPCPEGLTRQLLRLSRLGVPLYVTENGVYDNEDRIRPRFLVDHVRAVHDAIRRGADVRGYFFWSLVDNFEWAEGWSTHFGLFSLDRETQARAPRGSAEVYARICRDNGLQ